MTLVRNDNVGTTKPSGLPSRDPEGEDGPGSIGSFEHLPDVQLASAPVVCPSCGHLVDPLTCACLC